MSLLTLGFCWPRVKCTSYIENLPLVSLWMSLVVLENLEVALSLFRDITNLFLVLFIVFLSWLESSTIWLKG